MLKGVSHRIIEVSHPDSLYFERAVFYLRPEADDLPVHAALCETERFFAAQSIRRSARLRGVIWFLAGAAAAVGVCLLMRLVKS